MDESELDGRIQSGDEEAAWVACSPGMRPVVARVWLTDDEDSPTGASYYLADYPLDGAADYEEAGGMFWGYESAWGLEDALVECFHDERYVDGATVVVSRVDPELAERAWGGDTHAISQVESIAARAIVAGAIGRLELDGTRGTGSVGVLLPQSNLDGAPSEVNLRLSVDSYMGPGGGLLAEARLLSDGIEETFGPFGAVEDRDMDWDGPFFKSPAVAKAGLAHAASYAVERWSKIARGLGVSREAPTLASLIESALAAAPSAAHARGHEGPRRSI